MSTPDPQDPNSPLYQFIDTQPASSYPNNPDSSLSHFTIRQFTPEAITNTFPIIVTKTNHGLLNGQAIRATKFVEMPYAVSTGMYQLNNRLFYVKQVTLNTFQLCDVNTISINGIGYVPYIQGGEFTLTGEMLTVNPSPFPPEGT